MRETAEFERLREVVEGVLPEGTELVEARFSGGPLLTVLLDREDGPVDHEFCSRVASVVAPAVEAEGYDGPIEVSSPGIERPLTRPEHFQRFVGHEAKVRIGEPLDGRRNFTGVIDRAGEDAFVLRLSEGAEVELPFGSVTRANLKEDTQGGHIQMNTALLSALREIETDKGIPFETVKGVLEESLLAAYQGREGAEEEARVVLDEDTGDLRVVKDGEDITPHDFTRIAAQVMRQTFYQRLNEVHNEQLLGEYGERMGDVVTGIVQQAHRRMTLVDLGRVEAILPASEQVPNERYENGQRLKVYLLEIREGGRGPSLTVSRRHEGLLKNLFELEVPEIYDGLVEIRAVAREAGLRSKVAVWSKEAGVDPVGACVGPRGSRVRAVVSELRNEKIDIIQWDPEPARFIAKALSPARVREVYLDEDEKQAEVIVPDDQLSLAIGREGQNARLAVKLTDWKIDIKPESQATEYEEEEEDWEPDEDSTMHRCRAVLSNGRRCANMALPGSLFCGIPSHQAQAAEFEGMVGRG